MEYDQTKVDEMTLALLYLVTSRVRGIGRASKALDWKTLDRLHQKGWISDPKEKGISFIVTPEGMKKSEELFKKHFQDG